MARVKDTYFTHQNSNKGLRQPLKDIKLQPPSKSEEKEALAKLRKIVPNASVFSKDESDTDTASEDEEGREKLIPTVYHPHMNFKREWEEDQLFMDEKHEPWDEKEQLSPPWHHYPYASSGKTGDNDNNENNNSNSDGNISKYYFNNNHDDSDRAVITSV